MTLSRGMALAWVSLTSGSSSSASSAAAATGWFDAFTDHGGSSGSSSLPYEACSQGIDGADSCSFVESMKVPYSAKNQLLQVDRGLERPQHVVSMPGQRLCQDVASWACGRESNCTLECPPVADTSLIEVTATSGSLDAVPLAPTQGPMKFVFRHLSKCGGTFLRKLLPSVVRSSTGEVALTSTNPDAYCTSLCDYGDHLVLVSDRFAWPRGLRADNQASRFVMAGMRNPCEWYLSEYAFEPGKASSLLRKESRWYGIEHGRHHEGAFNVSDFREWLRDIHPSDSVGFFSWFFWQIYLAPPECFGAPVLHDGPCSVEQAQLDLHGFNLTEVADCWYKLDDKGEKKQDLVDSARICLQRYESVRLQRQVGGTSPSLISLEEYVNVSGRAEKKVHTSLVDGEQDHRRAGRVESVFDDAVLQNWMLGPGIDTGRFGGDLKDPRERRKRSWPCSAYFDEESTRLVKRLDADLFSKFGYESCCLQQSAENEPEK